jgi:hypothetical protein
MGFYNPINQGSLYSIGGNVLPPQSISLKDKLAEPSEEGSKSWKHQCMDSLESIGRSQFNLNLKLIENYEMIKGRFIFDHYFQAEGYQSMLNQLTAEFELPNYLRHYDIISQVVNTMSGEWQKRPDTFKVRQVGEAATNEYLRKKTELTTKYLIDKIDAEINARLAQQGIDVNKEDFNSPEEQQQYQEQLGQMKEQLAPKDIQKYMDIDFLTQAEMWGQHRKEYDREMFNLPEKEKIEFEDMLVADRAFRHFYITSTGYSQETWNPVNVFFHKSPDTVYIEDGDYVGRVFNLSINTIIDRYGHLMSKEDFENIQGISKETTTNWADSQYNWVYNNYLMPFKGFPSYDIMKDSWNKPSDGGIPQIDDMFFSNLQDNNFFREREGFYFVTEAYWKSQKKLIKLTYIDEETGQIAVNIVDENYIIPNSFAESKNIFDTEHDINTYCETYINEVWKGIKINTGVTNTMRKDLYLDIKPNDFQFKGDINIYGSKLPVCGQVFSVRNSRSMSLVDMMKPYQIGYNVCMNQIYQLMEKEIGMFVVMDVNMFPSSKDWGGEDAWDKWMNVAKNYGILPADTSPQNVRNSLAATGGFLPKVLDLNLASQMVSRTNLATFFEQQALKQVGFNQYRTGDFASSTTATGVQQGQAKSYSQTESYFTNFSNYLRRCLQMGLSIAQFVESKKPTSTFTYVKSDFSRAFINILSTDLLLADLGVMVTNDQENARQLEMIRQFAIQNNTSGMSPVDVANIISMNSPNEIKQQLKLSYDKLQQQQQQAQEMEKQKLDQEQQIAAAELKQKQDQFDALMENNLERERIKAGVALINSDTKIDIPEDNSLQMNMQQQNSMQGNNLKMQKLELEKQKAKTNAEIESRKLALNQAKINADLQIQNKQTESMRILKGQEQQ